MRVAEIFHSVQGEGRLVGVPSVFVRTSGCPLRCEWCDTPFTSWHPEGELLAVEEILRRLEPFPSRHAVLTGGEPLVAPGIEDLCTALKERRYHVTVETAAVVFKPLACDLASLSPKLSNSTPRSRDGGRFADSHERQRLRLDVIRAFLDHCDYQLKFVIDRPDDVREVLALLEQLPPVDADKVLLMPQGVSAEDLKERSLWLVDQCKRYGFRYCPRLHIDLYGHRRGT